MLTVSLLGRFLFCSYSKTHLIYITCAYKRESQCSIYKLTYLMVISSHFQSVIQYRFLVQNSSSTIRFTDGYSSVQSLVFQEHSISFSWTSTHPKAIVFSFFQTHYCRLCTEWQAGRHYANQIPCWGDIGGSNKVPNVFIKRTCNPLYSLSPGSLCNSLYQCIQLDNSK